MRSLDASPNASTTVDAIVDFNDFRELISEFDLALQPPHDESQAPAATDFTRGVVRIKDLCRTTSPRSTGIDLAHVRRLLETSHTLPPIVVHRPSMQLIDGHHRVAAAAHIGCTELDAYFFDGPADAAFILSVSANITHGLPLSLSDRRSAVARILETHPHLADRAIASATGLSARAVADMRNLAGSDSQIDKRLGRDGRLRPLDAAAGRALAAQLIEDHPEASLRQIAAAAGVSPGTVRDVRARLSRGEPPASPKTANRQPQHALTHKPNRRPARPTEDPSAQPGDIVPLLQTLSKDPALRLNAAGRHLLRWLHQHVIISVDCAKIVDEVPDHCVDHLVELAHRCASNWRRVALDLERCRAVDAELTDADDELRTG